VIAVALAGVLLGASCPALSVDGAVGADLFRNSSGAGVDPAYTMGAILGADLEPCTGGPWWVEASLRGMTLGPDGGVDAVNVNSWGAAVSTAAGVAWPVMVRAERTLAALLLVGPELRMTRTTIDIYGDKSTSTGWDVFAATSVGLVLSFREVRLAPRATLTFPGWHPALLFAVGWKLP
jgi:hypothetical protein